MSSPIDDSFPTPVPEDTDDVELALETAAALWSKGDRAEALRWLRRGAEAAEQAGNDQRALELARRAAELDASPPTTVAEPETAPEIAPEAEPDPPPSVTAPTAVPTLPAATSKAPEPSSVRVSQPPPKPAQRSSVMPDPSQRSIEATKQREPIRVYVKTSARDQSLLIVRPLENGRKAPFGTKEAMLVFEEPS
jgi:hypothetical protein